MLTTTETPKKKIIPPPCYDYRFFYGVGVITLNDQMADNLSSALQRSDIKSDVLTAIAQDLVGSPSDAEFDDRDDGIPSYTYTYFRNCGTLKVNKAAADLLAMAISSSGKGRPVASHLWSLHHQLKDGPRVVPTHARCPQCQNEFEIKCNHVMREETAA